MTVLVALMLSHQLTPADCFMTSSNDRPRTALAFRNHQADSVATASVSSILQQETTPLPPWLASSKSHLAESNLQELTNAMRASFFTENESLRLVSAIEEAANGDRNLLAGAADFCLILVETMEMGLQALVAAAFHYCSCVTARTHGNGHLSLPTSIEAFGIHAVSIAHDAARLKQLEMVAAMVMQNEGHRVRPDKRDAENLQSLLLSETKDWRGLAIRSAACLYRLRGLSSMTPESGRVAREALYIYAPLASRLGMHRLKNELEGAAFCILYPRQYETVNSLARQIRRKRTMSEDEATNIDESMRAILERVEKEMTIMLEQDEEFTSLVQDFTVTARVKEPYSMWKKMLRHDYDHILQVPDALALRIVLDAKKLTPDEPREVTRARERALCYYAQRVCTERWKPVEGNPRFKDYIESPKPNGYQSLHYTAKTEWADQDWTMEIQIRSGEMHQVAEFGLASHWDYKAQQKLKKKEEEPKPTDIHIDHSSDAYLRNVQQWHWQQHGGAHLGTTQWDASFEPVTAVSDIWQSRVRADRIRARTQRLEPYIQALTDAQSDLTREYVFVFLTQSSEKPSEGKVLALPAGACVLDALREGERTLGIPLSDDQLALNGDATSVTRQLHNGDILTIPYAVAM